jgi:hypothetical protein
MIDPPLPLPRGDLMNWPIAKMLTEERFHAHVSIADAPETLCQNNYAKIKLMSAIFCPKY